MPFLPWIECIPGGWTGLHTFWDNPGIENLAHNSDNLLEMESPGNKTFPCSCWKPQTCRGWLCLLQHVPIQAVHENECVCICAYCVHTHEMNTNFQTFETLTKIKVTQTIYVFDFLLPNGIWYPAFNLKNDENHDQNYNFIIMC